MGQPLDTVDHPLHYQSASPIGLPILRALNLGDEILKLECIEAIETLESDARWPFSKLNAIKYLWRVGQKGNSVEDLRKAAWYFQRYLDRDQAPNIRIAMRVHSAIVMIDAQILKLELNQVNSQNG
jgi:hypothetical protein